MTVAIPENLFKAVEAGLLGLVLGLGLICFLTFAIRTRILRRTISQAEVWRRKLTQNLEQEMGEFASGLAAHPQEKAILPGAVGAPERLVNLGFAKAGLCPDALDRLLQAQERRERRGLEKGARLLGTVGANAPFLGLTGTVLGILSAFRRMADQGGSGGGEVMAAIAGALVATAAGLLVAIPAVVLYNALKAQIKSAMEGLAEIRDLLVARSLQATARELI